MRRLSSRLASRTGLSLAELLVALVLLGLVMGTMLRVVTRQQRFYRAASEIIDTRSQLRQAVAVLPAELRGLSRRGSGSAGSAANPDLLDMRDSAVDARVTIGSGVVCGASGSSLYLAPLTLAKDNALTTVAADLPAAGDLLFVFNDGDPLRGTDDQWSMFTLSADVATSTTVCTSGPFVEAADASQPRLVATIAGGYGFTVPVGTPIRFARRVRYSLYRAGDNQWYLGYRSWNGTSWSTIQPVSGPYRPYSSTPGSTGLRFTYFDSTGWPAASRATVARIDIAIRGQTSQPIGLVGATTATYRDSLITRVAIRNRN